MYLRTGAPLELHPIGRTLGGKAAQIALDYKLRGSDAIYVALSEQLMAPLVTWDREIIERAGGFFDVRRPT
jgi:predicted nucleic acid-binding protein